MAMPPDMPAKDLWAKLQERPRPHKVVDFPRLDDGGEPIGKLAIWVLTQDEQMASNAEAEKFARKLLKDGKRGDLGYEALFDNEGAVQVVWRACRNESDLTKPLFPTPQAIREKLTADEVGTLFEHYVTVQLQFGPIISNLQPEEFESWVKRLDEGQAFFFDRLSSGMKTILALTMARQLVSFWTDKSSAGSPPVDDAPAQPSDEPPAA